MQVSLKFPYGYNFVYTYFSSKKICKYLPPEIQVQNQYKANSTWFSRKADGTIVVAKTSKRYLLERRILPKSAIAIGPLGRAAPRSRTLSIPDFAPCCTPLFWHRVDRRPNPFSLRERNANVAATVKAFRAIPFRETKTLA